MSIYIIIKYVFVVNFYVIKMDVCYNYLHIFNITCFDIFLIIIDKDYLFKIAVDLTISFIYWTPKETLQSILPYYI